MWVFGLDEIGRDSTVDFKISEQTHGKGILMILCGITRHLKVTVY